MSIKKYCLLPFIAVCLIACGTKKEQQPEPAAATTPPEQKEDNFVPYVALLQQEISVVDSTPLAIYKYTTGANGKTDTTVIQREEFHQLAKQFLEPDITSPALRKEYTASSFGDRTTNLVSFTYDTKNAANEIQRVSLRFKPGPGSKLTSLDMVKNRSGAMQKLFWKSNRYFHIISGAGNGKYTRVEVAWNIAAAEPEVEPY